MIQIPAKYLPETMEAYFPDPNAKRDGEYLEPVTIERVRFERANALSVNDYQLAEGASGRIWIDAVNSLGAVYVPEGSKVVINGEILHVLSVATYKATGAVHHWELDVA